MLINQFNHYRARRIASLITPLLEKNSKVLDFGGGNMLIAKYIKDKINTDIYGMDVIKINHTNIPFLIYDGKKIPLADKSFDELYASFVFHHIKNIRSTLAECVRVCKKRIIILEDTPENNIELFVAKILDLSNLFLARSMSIPLNFHSQQEWLNIIRGLKIKKVKVYSIRPNPIKPTRHRLFILDL